MSDDQKRSPFGADGDTAEADALKDLLGGGAPSGPQVDSNIFEQNLFGAPPPPPAPKPAAPQQIQPPAPPVQQVPVIIPEPAPEPPVAETQPVVTEPEPALPPDEDDIRIVSSTDFDQLISAPAEEPAPALTIEGNTAMGRAQEDWPTDEEDLPELAVAPSPIGYGDPPPAPYEVIGQTIEPPVQEEQAVEQLVEQEMAPQPSEPVESPDSWALESPVDESASLEDALSAQVPAPLPPDEMPLTPEATPIVFKAAKAKEGAKAIEETRDLIEKLDGLDEGFLDVAEVRAGWKVLADIVKRVEELSARIEAMEARLK